MEVIMRKLLITLVAILTLLTVVACKNQDEDLIKNFLNDYYSYIEKVNDDNIHDLASEEINYTDKSVLKKYLDEKTVGILVADREYLSPVYLKLGIDKADLKIDSIEKEKDFYRIKYHLQFSQKPELKEEHEISLVIDGDKIKLKSGRLGPTKNIQELLDK